MLVSFPKTWNEIIWYVSLRKLYVLLQPNIFEKILVKLFYSSIFFDTFIVIKSQTGWRKSCLLPFQWMNSWIVCWKQNNIVNKRIHRLIYKFRKNIFFIFFSTKLAHLDFIQIFCFVRFYSDVLRSVGIVCGVVAICLFVWSKFFVFVERKNKSKEEIP